MSYAYISRIEANTRTPSVKAVRKLARKLGVSPEYLETGSEIGAVDQRELDLVDAELRLRFDGDPADAEAALRRVLEEAMQAGDVQSATRARVGLGLAAARRGDGGEAVRRLEETLASGLVSPSLRPDVYTALGASYAALGKPARAVELLERCLDELREESDANVGARTRFATRLGYALTDVGDLAGAEEVMTAALAEADDFVDPYAQVRHYWSLGRRASLEGRPRTALAHSRRALALLEATEDTVHLARAHVLSGAVMNLNGNAEQAVRQLETAEQLLGKRPDRDDLVALRCEQARAAAQLGEPDEAVSRGEEVLELLDGDNPAEQGIAWWAIAEGHALRDDAASANEAYGRAADLLSGEGRWRDAANACRSWGRFLRRAGREGEALDVLERAADLAARREAAEVPAAP